jgi:hypothetical protein
MDCEVSWWEECCSLYYMYIEMMPNRSRSTREHIGRESAHFLSSPSRHPSTQSIHPTFITTTPFLPSLPQIPFLSHLLHPNLNINLSTMAAEKEDIYFIWTSHQSISILSLSFSPITLSLPRMKRFFLLRRPYLSRGPKYMGALPNPV